MVAPVSVVVVPAIVVGVVKATSAAFSHLMTDPVLPLSERLVGEVL